MSTALESVTEFVQELLEDSEDADLKDVTVLWGPPTGDDAPGELVAVGFGTDGQSGESEREWGPIGGGKLDEAISLDICVQVTKAHVGKDLKAAYTRSREIATAVETELRTDTTLGDLLLLPARLSTWRGRYFRDGEARGHRWFLTLTGSARI